MPAQVPPRPATPDQQQIGFNINSEPLLAGEPGSRTREKLRQQLREGKLDERIVELEVREKSMPAFEIITNQGVEEMDVNMKDMLPNIFGQRTRNGR